MNLVFALMTQELYKSKPLRTRQPEFDPLRRRDGDFSSLLRVQTGTGVHSSSYKMNTLAVPGVNTAKRNVSHLTSS